MRPSEASDYVLSLPEAEEFKLLSKQTIELKNEMEEIDLRKKDIKEEIQKLNKARWPLLQKLYRIVNKKFDYFEFDELKKILW